MENNIVVAETSEWTEVGGVVNLKKHQGESFVGEYVESEEREGQFGKDYIHHFIGEDGAPLAIYGMSTLDRAIKKVRPGSMCRITFIGKLKTKDGKKDYNAVRLEVKKNDVAPDFSEDFPRPANAVDSDLPF